MSCFIAFLLGMTVGAAVLGSLLSLHKWYTK